MKHTMMAMTMTALGVAASGAAKADHLELLCYERHGSFGRDEIRVEVADEGGRLVASVFAESDFGRDRLIKREGVSERSASGRALDLLYVGRELKLSLASWSLDGTLELKLNGRTQRIPVACH